MKLDANYWSARYSQGKTGWDIGQASPSLINYCKDLAPQTKILIPGAGRAYEYLALKDLGFSDVRVIDFAPALIEELEQAFPQHRKDLLCEDFFKHQGLYDLILEQTFFCALNPELRTDYVVHMHTLLKPNARLAGLYFNREFDSSGPPFGGDAADYKALLERKFSRVTIDYNPSSISARKGAEVFIESIK